MIGADCHVVLDKDVSSIPAGSGSEGMVLLPK